MSVATMNHDEEARLFAYTDPAIKLFGRDIPLAASIAHEASGDAFSVPDEQFSDKDTKPEMAELEERLKPMDVCSDELESSGCLNDGDDAMDGSDAANELVVGDDAQIVPGGSSICVNIKGSEDSHCLLAVASHEKMPKKPDKLIPCPRCHSLDTKFCYFNNYNVNQPRHFCRKCQRYWTAGGSLRNVPVGAGRRKHKHSISHQKHLLVSDTMPVRTSFMDGANQRSSVSFSTGGSALSSTSKPTVRVSSLDTHAALRMESLSSNSTMLNFGQESPLCRSMAATTLSMRECAGLNSNSYASGDAKIIAANEKQFPEVVRGFSCNMASNSTAGCYDAALTNASKMVMPSSSCTTSNSPPDSLVGAMGSSSENELKVNSCNKGQGMQLSEAGYGNCGADWQQEPSGSIVSNTPFNPAIAYTGLNGAPLRSPPTNMLPSCSGASGSCWAGFPWPLMNPAMWGPPTSEWVGPWTLPFSPPAATATAAAAAAAAATLFQYPASAACTLEKSEGSQPEKCLWVPKTLRIDDPLDAARSSIWAALGLGDGPSSSPINGSSVRMFQVKSEFKDYTETSKSQQHTNPAASSRSAAFHENI